MTIRIACPGCQTPYSCPEEYRGKKLRCKKCQREFLVGAPAVVTKPEPRGNAALPMPEQDVSVRAARINPAQKKGVSPVLFAAGIITALLIGAGVGAGGMYLATPLPKAPRAVAATNGALAVRPVAAENPDATVPRAVGAANGGPAEHRGVDHTTVQSSTSAKAPVIAVDQPAPTPEVKPAVKPVDPPPADVDPIVADGAVLPKKAVVGQLFTYQLSFEKGKPVRPLIRLSGPRGLELTPQGLIRWTPDKASAGTKAHIVMVRAGTSEVHRYDIEVEGRNANVAAAPPKPVKSAPKAETPVPPVASSDPAVKNGDVLPRKAIVGKPFTFQLSAGKDKAIYTQIMGPKGLTVSPEGLVRWTPEKGMAGSHRFMVQLRRLGTVLTYKVVVDEAPESGIALLPLSFPGGWTMTPDNVTLIVSQPEMAQLVYFDTVANKEMKRVDLDFQPGALALQGKTLFVAARGASLVYALNADTGKVKKEFNIGGDAVAHLACHPSKGLIYASTTRFTVYSLNGASGEVAKTAATGFFLAVDPVKGEFVYTGVQPPDREGDEYVFKEGKDGSFHIYYDRWGRRAVLMKFAVDGKDLKFVSGQNNAAVNGWAMCLTPDGKRIMMMGGGGWRPKDDGAGGGYVEAVYSTSNLQTMVGQAPHGLNSVFHPVLNLGVTNVYGSELILFNAKSLVKKGTIPVAQGREQRVSVLTFGGRGGKIILWNGENVKERQGLYFIPLDLTKADRAALAAAYGKP